MNEVFKKTRELAQALLESEEYKAVKAAEDKAFGNKQAAEIVGKYLEAKRRMEEIMSENSKDWGEVQRLTDEIDKYTGEMAGIEDLVNLNAARDRFSGLINDINKVLQLIITGEINEDEGECSGSCSSCRGCSAKVN
ncbi:MAG: YlbF family regulator [Clostridiales bacterium]|nr:YlbF family regulator [Clostridiales bacterium]